MDSKNSKKISEKFSVFEIIASELVVLNSLYLASNTCHGQSLR